LRGTRGSATTGDEAIGCGRATAYPWTTFSPMSRSWSIVSTSSANSAEVRTPSAWQDLVPGDLVEGQVEDGLGVEA
jgi:hypothetical protein